MSHLPALSRCRRARGGFLGLLVIAWLLAPDLARADRSSFPPDFTVPPQVIAGAGGGVSRSERDGLQHLPVILIADNARTHEDWLGRNRGNAPPPGNVYEAFLAAGFAPIELWMLDLVAEEGEQLTSLELRTDNLKELIFAVLEYTGADQVQILAHGAGAVLAQATLIKYNLFWLVHSVAYIAGPFHGTYLCSVSRCLEGLPLCCNLTPGSDFLQDVLVPDETPFNAEESEQPGLWGVRYLTVRNGRRFGDAWFARNPDSPALRGARNLAFPAYDHDGLRCAPEVLEQVIPFLTAPARPLTPEEDRDRDGYRSSRRGGPDCDDLDPRVHPGAKEICGDGVDQDCNGHDLRCAGGKDRDVRPEALPRPPDAR
jgi:pimeloyl-ACP methyl ester carboxylesterase